MFKSGNDFCRNIYNLTSNDISAMKKLIFFIDILVLLALIVSCEKEDTLPNIPDELTSPHVTFELNDSLYNFELQEMESNFFLIRHLQDDVELRDSVILGYEANFTDKHRNSRINILICKMFDMQDLDNDISQLSICGSLVNYVYDSYINFSPVYLPTSDEKTAIFSDNSYQFIEMYSRTYTDFLMDGVRIELYEDIGGYADWTSTIPMITSGDNYGEYIDLSEEFQVNSTFQITEVRPVSNEELDSMDGLNMLRQGSVSEEGHKINILVNGDFNITLYRENGDMLKLKNGHITALF